MLSFIAISRAVPHIAVVISLLPSKEVLLIFLDTASLVAVDALPVSVPFIVLGNFNVTLEPPFTLTAAPIFVLLASSIEIFLAVPHENVVIAVVPSKSVPLIFLAVASLVVVAALPVRSPVILGILAFVAAILVAHFHMVQ